MRLTINLDGDLYELARAHAFAERVSISRAVNVLLRGRVGEGRPSQARGARPPLRYEGRRRFPVSTGARPFGSADVERIETEGLAVQTDGEGGARG